MKSKILAVIALGFLGIGSVTAQTPLDSAAQVQANMQSAQWNVNHSYRVFQAARSLNDLAAAKDALLHILVEVPGNDSIIFELSAIYFQMQMYQSSAITAAQVMAANPNHVGAMEVAALSFENLGVNDKALENYEKLYLATDDFNALYKSSLLQYDLKRFKESVTNIDILLTKKEADELKIPLVVEGDAQKEYPLRALLHNLHGMCKVQLGDNAGAKTAFEAALAIAPDFVSAKEQLANINK